MYKQVKTELGIILGETSIVTPVATLEDEWGERAHIIEDDRCYILCLEYKEDFCRPTHHIFHEALEVIRHLPSL